MPGRGLDTAGCHLASGACRCCTEAIAVASRCGIQCDSRSWNDVLPGRSFSQYLRRTRLAGLASMMFANMDYPFEDREFLETARAEAECELSRLGRHASLAVVCGNSEVEQQVGMLGLDPALGRGDWFGRELPEIVARHCPGVPYVPSAPSGGDMPFRSRTGVANYFGVGAICAAGRCSPRGGLVCFGMSRAIQYSRTRNDQRDVACDTGRNFPYASRLEAYRAARCRRRLGFRGRSRLISSCLCGRSAFSAAP